jgi:hypothetical protein
MKTKQELMVELVQVLQENQKNLTRLLEHHKLLEHHVSIEKKKKKKKGFKSKVVGEAKTSLREEGLTEPQVDFLDVHDDGVCNEVYKTIAFDTSLELSYEGSDC